MSIFSKFLLLAFLLLTSCSPAYYHYAKGVAPDHINNAKTIPVWVDTSFTMDQKINIMEATNEWNLVFNKQIIIKVEGYFNGVDGGEEKYKDIRKTGLGWVFLKVNEDDDLVKGVIGRSELAFVPGLGSHILVVLGDRVGTRDLKVILLHEIGHLLGADHINYSSLMVPIYGKDQYNCVDKTTVALVASFQELDFSSLNYCVTPYFE